MLILAKLIIAGVSMQAAAPAESAQFLESLIASEVNLQLDRREVRARKNDKAALQTLMASAATTRATIQTFLDTKLAGLPSDAPKPLLDFQSSLEAFKVSLEADKILDFKASGNGTEVKACCNHDAAYLKFVVSALRTPGISIRSLSAPTEYNLWPVLYERNHGLIYADPSASEKAQILPRIARKGSKFRKGDVIVAVRGDDEEEWENVSTWKDVLKASNDFETGEHDVFIQIRRDKKIKNLVVTSSTVIVNTE